MYGIFRNGISAGFSVNLRTGLVFCRREGEEFGIDAQERYGNDGSLL